MFFIMTSPTEAFFDDLSRRGRVPMLARANGTIRFELTGGPAAERWILGIERGEVRVSRDDVEADCVVRVDRALFDAMASGRLNALAALLRGVLFVEGDPMLLVLAQRLFPAAPDKQELQPVAAADGRAS